MHDLVVAKVAVHRRRRALLASAGGGVAVVLLLVAVAAGATGSGPDDSVKAGEGDPTSTTEAPTTTESPEGPTSTDTTTTAPPETTTTTEAPTTTTEAAPPTSEAEPPTTSTTAPAADATSTVVNGTEGDMEATFTVTTDPARPGFVSVRVQITDPTGRDVHPGMTYPYGPGAMILGPDGRTGYAGDVPASCGHGDLEGVEPGQLDEVVELELPSGPQSLRLRAFTLPCHDEVDEILLDHDVVVP
jgi:hypothetical protein